MRLITLLELIMYFSIIISYQLLPNFSKLKHNQLINENLLNISIHVFPCLFYEYLSLMGKESQL